VFAPAEHAKDAGFLAGLGEGVRWLARHRQLRAMAVLGALFSLTDAAWFAILVLYVERVLHLPAVAYGLLLAVGAVGGLAGGVAAARLRQRMGPTAVLLLSLVAAGAAQLVLAVTRQPAAAGAALAVSSFAFALWNVVSMTLRQTLTPTELQGRVTGAYRTLLMGSAPIGALIGGAVAGHLGLRAPFLLGIPVMAATAVFGGLALRGNGSGAEKKPIEA